MNNKRICVGVYDVEINKFRRYMFISGLIYTRANCDYDFDVGMGCHEFDVYYDETKLSDVEKINYIMEKYYTQQYK